MRSGLGPKLGQPGLVIRTYFPGNPVLYLTLQEFSLNQLTSHFCLYGKNESFLASKQTPVLLNILTPLFQKDFYELGTFGLDNIFG